MKKGKNIQKQGSNKVFFKVSEAEYRRAKRDRIRLLEIKKDLAPINRKLRSIDKRNQGVDKQPLDE